MATVSNPNQSFATFERALEDIINIFRSLPPTPTIEHFAAVSSILRSLEPTELINLEQISNQESSVDLPSELSSLLQATRKRIKMSQSIEIYGMFRRLEELIQRAENSVYLGEPVGAIDLVRGTTDGVLMKLVEVEESMGNRLEHMRMNFSISTPAPAGARRGNTPKFSLLEVAALFESYIKTGASVLNLHRKLKDQVEWLPLSLGKLLNLIELDISENQILALPSNLGELIALRKIDIHSNQLINLPQSIGELVNLTDLNLHGNRLKSLPTSFGSLIGLINLDLSSNLFVSIPDSIGNLNSLERLNLELNELEELPCTIDSCTSLLELRLDFNRLKTTPGSIGHLEKLKILTLRYNRLKNLPTTVSSLGNLIELDVSFNELQSIPELLCFIISLRKLNVGGNFVDFTSLPMSIGHLEMLEELDISNDQVKVLPDSFGLLSRLRVLHVDETPLEVPPRHIAELGAEAVVHYMAEKRSNKFSNQARKKGHAFCSCILSLFCLDEIIPTDTSY